MLYVATGLVLAGCRSSAVIPQFSASSGYHVSLPAQRSDTASADPVHDGATAQQPPATAKMQPQVVPPLDHPPRETQEPAGEQRTGFANITTGDTTRRITQVTVPREARRARSPKLLSTQALVHYSLHFVFPAVLALVFFPLMWQTAYLIMLATMLIDLDHLLAKPVFDPLRCSIGYHPLHSFYAIPVYALLLLLPATQIIAVGLLFHLLTDTVDCLWNFSHCHECYLNSRIYALRNQVRKLLSREAKE